METFSILHEDSSRDEIFEYLVELGKVKIPHVNFSEEDIVKSCQAKTWFNVKVERGAFKLTGQSESIVINGLIVLLINAVDALPISDWVDYKRSLKVFAETINLSVAKSATFKELVWRIQIAANGDSH